jgi:S-adenosylmethionine synthetase
MGKLKVDIERTPDSPIENHSVEIVERKGLGHPDYMSDSIAEEFSKSLANYYLEKTGRVLHYNVDKLEIIGGAAEPEWNGGRIISYPSVLFSGRATDRYNEERIPVREIAIESAKRWIKRNIRFLDPDKMNYLFETKKGAVNLSDAFDRKTSVPRANDTSFGAGYAPLSETENLVFSIERFLNSREFKDSHPFSGEDVKVMGLRLGKRITITVANAIIDRFVSSADDYAEKKAVLKEAINGYVSKGKSSGREISTAINGMDDTARGKDGCYLTVSGSSVEHGDDGAVGRGNRVNGLITPGRVMSLEATAGKNPINHVGKLYNVLAFRIADSIFKKTGEECSAIVLGRIGEPINEPLAVSIKLYKDTIKRETIEDIATSEVNKVTEISDGFIKGDIAVC